MLASIIALSPVALILVYLKFEEKNKHPLSSKKGKWQLAIIVLLLLLILVAGTWDAFTQIHTRRQQYVQLLIVYSGPTAVLIGAGIAALRNKLQHPKRNSTHQK